MFDNQMIWLDHINHVSANISKRCGVLNRVKYNLPNCTLKMLAEAMIIPNFDYCSPVWSNCNNELKTRLQKHQNKLARIILSADIRTPINNMMTSLNWLKLDDRWTNQMLIMIFKCLNGTSPNYLSSKFIFTHSVHNYSTRGQISNSLIIPLCNSNSGRRMFTSRSSQIWNNLPQDIRINYQTMSLNQFRNNALTLLH